MATIKARLKAARKAAAPPEDTKINISWGDPDTDLVTVEKGGRPEAMTFREAARRFPRDYIILSWGEK
jgi:hypothetical protein